MSLSYWEESGPWVVLWSKKQRCAHVEKLSEFQASGPGDDYAIEYTVDTSAEAMEIATRISAERNA